jgi:hypothetical protein
MEASNPEFERALDAVIRDLHAAAVPLDVAGWRTSSLARTRGWALIAGSKPGARRRVTPGRLCDSSPLANLWRRLKRNLRADDTVRCWATCIKTKARKPISRTASAVRRVSRQPTATVSEAVSAVVRRLPLARNRAYIVVPDDVHLLWRPQLRHAKEMPRLLLPTGEVSTDDFGSGKVRWA